jgi:hypothetical protein
MIPWEDCSRTDIATAVSRVFASTHASCVGLALQGLLQAATSKLLLLLLCQAFLLRLLLVLLQLQQCAAAT